MNIRPLLVVPITIFFMLSGLSLKAQTRTISGYITNEESGEKLIGATLFDTVSKKGAGTNEYGFFSLTIPAKDAYLRVSYFGLKTKYIYCPLGKKELDISLSGIKEFGEITVSSEGSRKSTESTNTGTIELQMDKLDRLPQLLGEKDILRVIQLLPGVKSGGEASSGIYVRGGGPDQNLILLDGVPVYNASHLFGFFSIFNSDAVSTVSLVKGGFPARYTGRASSVLDMRMKEGNMKDYNVEGSVGIISSRILVEGPVVKNKSAFSFSARRTYLDLLTLPFQDPEVGKGGYFFHDVNAKYHHKINNKHHLYFSGYFGLDKAYFRFNYDYPQPDGSHTTVKDRSFLKWGNGIGAIRWNYKIGPRLFLNTTGTYSRYRFAMGVSSDEKTQNSDGTTDQFYLDGGYYSGIEDWGVKSDFTFIPNPNHHVRFGLGNTYHTFIPGVFYLEYNDLSTNLDTTLGSKRQFNHEFSSYIENDHRITERLKVNYGLAYSVFFAKGRNYPTLQPRINANFILNEVSSLKLGLSRMNQFMHLLTNTGIGLPTDLWVPATKNVKPIVADQISLGYNRTLNKVYNLVIEGYYKKMNNLIQYKEGVNVISLSDDWESRVTTGQGWSYGGELLIEKKKGKLTGWLGYTLSWAERQFDELNEGKKFFYRYDRRHDVSLALTYEIDEKWDFGLVFVYGTGNAVTLGGQNYYASGMFNQFYQNFPINYFDQLNNYRMPAYHRMDVGINRTKMKRWGSTVLSFSIYNVYNRQNAFMLFTRYNDKGKLTLYQYSLFPMIPSISWKFKVDFAKIREKKAIHETEQK